RVSPATPVWLTIPPVVARPCACVSWSTSPHSAPPCTQALQSAGSTRTPRIAERSMTIPSSQTAVPATLWPPPPILGAGETHGRDHVGGPNASGDEVRAPVNGTVPDCTGDLIVSVVGID